MNNSESVRQLRVSLSLVKDFQLVAAVFHQIEVYADFSEKETRRTILSDIVYETAVVEVEAIYLLLGYIVFPFRKLIIASNFEHLRKFVFWKAFDQEFSEGSYVEYSPFAKIMEQATSYISSRIFSIIFTL